MSVCLSVCLSVCPCHQVQFFSRPLIGPEVTWSDPRPLIGRRKKCSQIIILVLWSASVERFIVSRMRDFFFIYSKTNLFEPWYWFSIDICFSIIFVCQRCCVAFGWRPGWPWSPRRTLSRHLAAICIFTCHKSQDGRRKYLTLVTLKPLGRPSTPPNLPSISSSHNPHGPAAHHKPPIPYSSYPPYSPLPPPPP